MESNNGSFFNDNFSKGMLVNICLIIAGVAFLCWLSTFGDNDVMSKMEFYANGGGKFIGFSLVILPFCWLMQTISARELGNKKVLITKFVIVFSIQALAVSFTPNIVKFSEEGFATVGKFVINLKK